jgi:hypothetical protein
VRGTYLCAPPPKRQIAQRSKVFARTSRILHAFCRVINSLQVKWSVFWDVWRVYSNTPHSKGMTADRGGWVIGALGEISMPYFCPKLLSRPRNLDVPCSVDEAQARAISMRRIRSSINSCISMDFQVSSRLRMALMVHASQMKGKRVMDGGYWRPNVALTSLVLKDFTTFMHSGWY